MSTKGSSCECLAFKLGKELLFSKISGPGICLSLCCVSLGIGLQASEGHREKRIEQDTCGHTYNTSPAMAICRWAWQLQGKVIKGSTRLGYRVKTQPLTPTLADMKWMPCGTQNRGLLLGACEVVGSQWECRVRRPLHKVLCI